MIRLRIRETKNNTDSYGSGAMTTLLVYCREVNEITAGNIAVVSGLKLSMTGDTVVESPAIAKAAMKVENQLVDKYI